MDNIQKEHLSPFFSVLVAVNPKNYTSKQLDEAVLKLIKDVVNKDTPIRSFQTVSEIIGDAFVEITPYSLEKKPSWTTRNDIYDIENHVAITFVYGRYIAFYFSEKGMKDSVREHFKGPFLSKVEPVDISHLNYLFINEDSIKMLWLLGIHSTNTFKADSKVLGGSSVAESLDPLEDQSYMMSAVRTEIGNKNKTIGLNPFKSSIWRGPCKDWQTFENNVIEILDTLNSNNQNNHSPIGILASPINDLSAVKDAYDFTVLDPEFIPYELSLTKNELLHKIKNKYTTEVAYSSNTSFLLKVYFDGILCGDVSVKIKINDYNISFETDHINPIKDKKEILSSFLKIFKYPELLKCWYESGHAVVNSWIFKTDYKDVLYQGFIWADFESYNICQEKPTISDKLDLTKIGTQKSLFCWVKNRWSSKWTNADNFNTTEKPTGWLYCDDGAGEKADFIHIEEYESKTIISLIHVKAATRDSLSRKISVGAHDIVLSQAVKNLRYANRKNLLQDLSDRATNSQYKMCWRNNKQVSVSDFIKKLENIHANPLSTKTRVIVIQPHTIKSYYTKLQNSNIKRQLDVLLVSTDNAVKSSGAEFHIIGFDDN